MNLFDSLTARFYERDPLPPLFPTAPWQSSLSERILTASDYDMFGDAHMWNTEMALACRCGLLMWNDDIEAAHEIAQMHDNPTYNFWHAIMHRREGDFPNSQYWWSKTGSHPAFPAIYDGVVPRMGKETVKPALEFTRELRTAGSWQPISFVSRCETQKRQKSVDEWLRKVQVVEMRVLLQWCRQAMSA